MTKRFLSKTVSMAVSACLLLSTVLQNGIIYAEEKGTSLAIEQNQVNGEGSLDITKAGNVDWMHLKGDGSGNITQINKATTPSAISFNTLSNTGTEGKVDKGGDSDYLSYTWNDGMAGYETGSNDTGFGVFFPKDTRSTGICSGNVGWNFKVAAQEKETTVVFGLGLWQAKVDVNFYIDGDATPVDTKSIQAGGSAQVYKYQVTVPANKALRVEAIQTETLSQWGNFSLSGIAAGSVGSEELDIVQSQVSGVYAFDLTQVGNVDWMHLKGDGSNGLIQIKKETEQNAISFVALSNTVTEGKETNGDSNHVASTWSDGMSGYESGTGDTGFGVFLPLSDDRDAGPCKDNVGWSFSVTSQPTPTTVVFTTGLWQSQVDVNFYMNDAYAGKKTMSANGTAQVYKYQVTVPANTALTVKGVETYKNAHDGNSSVSSIAVSNIEITNKEALQDLYNEFIGITQSFFTDDSWKKFDDSRVATKTILDKVDATQAEVDNAKAALLEAQKNLVKKATNIMIDYTNKQKGLSYAFGHLTDQQDRYQTFTSSESFKMEYVQLGLTKSSDAGSDLIVKLYVTDSNGLPKGTPLAQSTVSKKDVISGGLTTAKLSYNIEANTRYAIDVTQSTLQNNIYCWTVMPKNYYTQNEFYGKTVSGSFVSEAQLGTGLLRVIKEVNVDRSALEALVTEVGSYSERIYTVESWLALTDALTAAKNCLSNFDASQEEINVKVSFLQAAKDSLVINVDIANMDSLISSLDNVVVKGYTDSSVAAVTDAIASAKLLGSGASQSEKLQAYANILNAISRLQESGQYTSETDGGLTGSFGFESDMNAPIAFIDGSFKLVSRGNLMVRFGVTGLKQKGVSIAWYNRDGYLPCYVSEYTADDVKYKIEEFSNKHIIDGNPVEVTYVKVTSTNNSGEKRLLPVVSRELLPLNAAAQSSLVINDKETVEREYAIASDRFENEGHSGNGFDIDPKVDFPSDQKIIDAAKLVADTGKSSVFENNYANMKAYWDNRLASVVDISLPNSKDANNKDSLVNAYKAGYIYTLIMKDNTFLHVGENGYDRLFSHDTIGILQSIITGGDFKYAKNYIESVPMTGGIDIENGKIDPDLYWDANWKLPWAYSVYLSKTGDIDYVKEKFEAVIKKMAHSIHDDRTGTAHDGIMKTTLAIDASGQWTVDDQAALMGLTAYKYICNELAIKASVQSDKDYYLSEVQWATSEYNSLLKVVTDTLENTISQYNLDYMPASLVEPNDNNRCSDPRDANWASALLFGGFTWDGYLYGADQSKAGANISMIDKTYAYGIDRRKDLPGATPYNFGGYPHGFYSSAYNAGYGIAALRGEAYRDIGIKSYEFSINSAMSSPFGWWEGVGPTNFPDQDPTSALWNHDNASSGGGSCQHMWGQATASKVLYDSLIAERIYNDNKNVDIIIGRGIPNEWVEHATADNDIIASVKNYPVLQGGRAGYKIERNGNSLKVTFASNTENSKVAEGTNEQWSVQLPIMVNNIAGTTVGTIDNAKGIVTIPANTTEATITLSKIGSSVSVGGVSLDKNTLSLAIGGTSTLKATITPAEADNKTVNFVSDNPGVATVTNTVYNNTDGTTSITVNAVSAGTASIKATTADGGKTAICTVSVSGSNGDSNTSITTPIVDIPISANNSVIAINSGSINQNAINVIKLQDRTEGNILAIPVSALGKGKGSLDINSGSVDLKVPLNIIDTSAISSDNTVHLSQNVLSFDASATMLSNIPNGARTNGTVFSLKMGVYDSNNKLVRDIHDFAEGKLVTVTLKLTSGDIKNLATDNMSVFYYDEDNHKWIDMGGSFDATAMTYTFTTSHFSNFALMQKSGASMSIKKLVGKDRIETSVEIAKESFSDKKPDAMIITDANNFPDALTGSGLAYKYNAPLLLVNKSIEASQKVIDYITSSLSKDKKIYALGGTGAVSNEIIDYLKTQGYNVERISGSNRYETNQSIFDKLNVAKGTPIVIATGESYADALSISSIASMKEYSIFLNTKEFLLANVREDIANIQPSTVYIVGGKGVISENVENELKALIPAAKIVRLGGTDRYDTSIKIYDYFNLDTDTVIIAKGENFPDALSGAVLAGKRNSGILIVNGKDITKQKALLSKRKVTKSILLGGIDWK